MGATNCPETPRQKMIGMMYLVLMAMLALNVSADILNGFTMVDESLQNNIETAGVRNAGLYDDMNYLYQQNPQKVGEWLEKSKEVKEKSDFLFNMLQEYKVGIIELADGKDADPEAKVVNKKDNIDVAGQYVGLSTGLAKGNALKDAIEDYRIFAGKMFDNDETKVAIYNKMYETGNKKNSHGEEVDWINATFQSMPVVAVVTLLSKYQNDVRSTEAEIINHFKAQTDAGDFRVNKIMAKLIPESKHVMQGGAFKAEIALMAVDSTKVPSYYVGNQKLDSCFINQGCGSIGTFPISGRIELINAEGEIISYPFEDEYTVGAPTATVANRELNLVYIGHKNKIDISVPGVASEKLRVNCSQGSIVKSGNQYIYQTAKNAKDGSVIKINVLAEVDGKTQTMGTSEFRVKTMPAPTAYIIINHQGKPYKWTPTDTKVKPTRRQILDGSMIAEYSDGLLQAKFKVTGFTIKLEGKSGIRNFGSSGNKFNGESKKLIRSMNKKILVSFTEIKVVSTEGNAKIPPILFPSVEI